MTEESRERGNRSKRTDSDEELTLDVMSAIQEAQILQMHVARMGKPVSDEARSTLALSKRIVNTDRWTAEAEADFWKCFYDLALAAQPATIASLRAAHVQRVRRPDRGSIFRGLSRPAVERSEAQRSVARSKLWTSISLVLLIVLQVYWFIGHEIVQGMELQVVETRYAAWTEAYSNYLSADRSTDEGRAKDKAWEEIHKKAYGRFEAAETMVEARLGLLKSWNAAWQEWPGNSLRWVGSWISTLWKSEREPKTTVITPANTAAQTELGRVAQESGVGVEPGQQRGAEIKVSGALSQEDQRRVLMDAFPKSEQGENNEPVIDKSEPAKLQKLADLKMRIMSGTFALRTLSDYVLPLIYGLLGAFAWVLRQLITDVENLSYTSASNTRYGLRLQLGALAGLAIGWFLAPEDLEKGLGSFSSPWGLAFVAGYSVEILFAQLDKFVTAFTAPAAEDGTGGGTAPPPAEPAPAQPSSGSAAKTVVPT